MRAHWDKKNQRTPGPGSVILWAASGGDSAGVAIEEPVGRMNLV
jgi:hypothetical protein